MADDRGGAVAVTGGRALRESCKTALALCAVALLAAGLSAHAYRQLSKLRPLQLEPEVASKLANLIGNPGFAGARSPGALPDGWHLHVPDRAAAASVALRVAAAGGGCAVATISNPSSQEVAFYTDVDLHAAPGSAFSFSAEVATDELAPDTLRVGVLPPHPEWFSSALVNRGRGWQAVQLGGRLPKGAAVARAHFYVPPRAVLVIRCPRFSKF